MFQPNLPDSSSLLPVTIYDENKMKAGASAPPFLLLPRNEQFVLGKAKYPAIQDRSGIVFVVILLFAFSALMASYINTEILAIRLGQTGKQSTANVISRRYTSGKSTTYYLTYRYSAVDPNGEPRTYTKEQTVTRSTYNAHLEGSTVTIAYLPEDASQVQLFGPDSQKGTTETQILFTLIPLGIAVGGLFFLTKPIIKDRYMADGGRLIEGRIVQRSGREVPRGKGSRAYQVTVTYDFDSPTGNKLGGTQKLDRNDLRKPKNQSRQTNLPPMGAPVIVLYKDDEHFKMM